MSRFLLFCRPGFEKDCAAEADERFAECGWSGGSQTLEPYGLVGYQGEFHDESRKKRSPFPETQELIFARQLLEGAALVKDLPAQDRAGPIAAALAEQVPSLVYRALILEHPDTNDGRALAGFCKKFSPALNNALKRHGFRFEPQNPAAPALHVIFVSYEKAYIAHNTRPKTQWKGGIPRLKFPEDAPSRSTLKLEEAFLSLLDEKERGLWLQQGGMAVDLGASPGGWTHQLLQKGFFVTAVDHGKMDDKVMASGMVDHKEEDAYKYKPKQAIELLVCDMVDKPQKVAALMGRWFQQKHCRWAVFNLKLPMKKRFEEWEICRELFWKESQLNPEDYEMRAKHLYHNREEITLLVKPRRRKGY